MSEQKVLIFDIEISPIIGYVWGMWEQNVPLNQIKADWHVLAWAAKWLGDPPSKIMYQDQRNARNIEDDKKLLAGIWELLDQADVVITQNGKAFDVKKLNARFIIQGMQPPSPYQHIDTKKIASSKFGFTSNKLEYLTDKLCTKYKKLKHKRFPGFELWSECLKGNTDAWNEMKKYNIYDVLSLEELYTKLRSWDGGTNLTNFKQFVEDRCECGNADLYKAGFIFTKTGKFQRYRCKNCGSQYRDKKDVRSLELRKSMKVKLGA